MQEQYILFGKIVSSVKFSNQLILIHNQISKKNIKKIKVIFIQKDKQFIPYFITNIQNQTETESIIILEDIDTFDIAKNFFKLNIYLNKEIFSQIETKNNQYLEGYTLINQTDEKIGIIINTVELNSQILLNVSYKNKTILIPLHKDIIIDLNNKNKIIKINIIEGLLDL